MKVVKSLIGLVGVGNRAQTSLVDSEIYTVHLRGGTTHTKGLPEEAAYVDICGRGVYLQLSHPEPPRHLLGSAEPYREVRYFSNLPGNSFGRIPLDGHVASLFEEVNRQIATGNDLFKVADCLNNELSQILLEGVVKQLHEAGK